MEFRSPEGEKLYQVLMDREYDPHFCQLIAEQMGTPWTAMRMLGYLRQLPRVSEEEIVDEMLGILSDRDRIRDKKIMEHAQSKINEIYNRGLGED